MHCTVKKDSFNFCERKKRAAGLYIFYMIMWKLDKNNKVHDDEIQITFKKGEPWATSIKTRKFMNLNFRTPKN